ncbi:MFS transporter [Brevibacillus nitrificans]|uniref:MFS transporter n=1 Tax=Brevibacillus nitrificans TaxID=651560 RepID=UPI00399CA355
MQIDQNVVQPTDSPLLSTGKRKPGYFRWSLAFLFFIIGLIAYMDRSNIAVVAEPMMKDLGMSKVQFGLLASLFSLGYAVSQIPGGILSERFGTRKIVTLALFFWSVFTMATAAVSSFFAMCIVRFLFGVGEGPLYPANAVFNTFWFQKHEKARAAGALLAGSYFGPVIAPAISVAIYQVLGWHGVFYVFGIIGIIIAGGWYLIGRDKPEQHPWVTEYERALIMGNRSVTDGEKKKAPWGRLLRNSQFWAVGLQYLAVAYMTSLFMTWLPTYLLEARHFSLQTMGFAASFPWLAICLVVLFGGGFSDALLRKGNSRMVARGIPAMAGLAIFIVTIYLASITTDPWLNVLWLSLALGSLGLPVVTSWAIAADKGGEFSGSVSGWMNTWGNVGAVFSPIICGWIAQNMGWDMALLSSIIPILIAIFLWFLIKPDDSLAEI